MTRPADAVVIGIGNSLAGDDAAGLAVTRLVRERGPAGLRVVDVESEPSRIVEIWEGADVAVLVDAVRSSAPPGTVRRIDARAMPLPPELHRASTHHLGLGDAVELARALDRLPARLVVYGIAGERFEAGSSLSAPVEAAIEGVAERVLREATGSN